MIIFKSKCIKWILFLIVPIPMILTLFFSIGVPFIFIKTNLLTNGTNSSKSNMERILNEDSNTDDWQKIYSFNKTLEFKQGKGFSNAYLINRKSNSLSNDKIIIFSHGLDESKWKSLVIVKEAIDNGYTVITYDQRGMGENKDNGNYTLGDKESNDLLNLYNQVNLKYQPKDIIFMGESEGAVSSLLFGANNINILQNSGIKISFILESLYTSRINAMHYMLSRANIPTFMAGFAKPMLESYTSSRWQENEFLYASKKLKLKTFFILTGADAVADIKGQKRIVEQRKFLNQKLTDSIELENAIHAGGLINRKYRREIFAKAWTFVNN